jgi:hypothetical protein
MIRTLSLCIAVLLCCFGSFVNADESKDVKWDEAHIIGSLGKPLGTWMRIEGNVPKEPIMMANPLEVHKVNGVELSTPVLIELHCDGKLEKGKSYTFRGYESGGMVSSPDDPENPSAGSPQQTYHFGVWFEGGSIAKD